MGDHLVFNAAARTLIDQYANGNDDAADVLAALAVGAAATLGATADIVAAACTRAKAVGHPGDEANNPISRMLAAALGATSVTVLHDAYAALTFRTPDGRECSLEGIELPEPVTSFLADFAGGRWEHLIDRDSRKVSKHFSRREDDRMRGVETVTRGTVVSSMHRGGSSDPLTDEQIAAIGSAGLAADDYADEGFTRLRLYRGDLAVSLITGGDMRFIDYGGVVMPFDTEWQACAGYQFCPRATTHTRFPSRDEALIWVLDNLGQTCHDRIRERN
jgi:hypothetical protein